MLRKGLRLDQYKLKEIFKFIFNIASIAKICEANTQFLHPIVFVALLFLIS